MRYSRQKEIIFEGLKKFCIHPDAEELYLRLKGENPQLSLATVYRNLNKMAADGEIKKICGLSGKSHYDHNTHEHFHVICAECGKIDDLAGDVVNDLKKTIKEKSDYKIFSYDIIVKGLCPDCKEKGLHDGFER